MKRIIVFIFAAMALFSCNESLSTNDYSYAGTSPGVFYDNNGNLCREGGVYSEWCVKGMYKLFEGKIYTFYVVPREEIPTFYNFWENPNRYHTDLSETGWVRLDDIRQKNIVSRVKDTRVYVYRSR